MRSKSIFFGLIFLSALNCARAHDPGLSKIDLIVHNREIAIQFVYAIKDIEPIVRIDLNGDGLVTEQELQDSNGVTNSFLKSSFEMKLDGHIIELNQIESSLDGIDGIRFRSVITIPFAVEMNFITKIMEQLAYGHRQFITIRNGNKALSSSILSVHNQALEIHLPAPDVLDAFIDYLRDGIWHIWIGYDHIVFLVSLLIPAAFLVKSDSYCQQQAFKPVLFDTVKIITAFTVAHSLTLGLTLYGIIDLPSFLVESIIAVSVLIAALNNIFLWINKRLWLLAGLFGLIHGMGFASVLEELGLPEQTKALALIAFNLGVELGQLTIVVLVLPLIYLFSQQRLYKPLVINAGSLCIAILASVWVYQRIGF